MAARGPSRFGSDVAIDYNAELESRQSYHELRQAIGCGSVTVSDERDRADSGGVRLAHATLRSTSGGLAPDGVVRLEGGQVARGSRMLPASCLQPIWEAFERPGRALTDQRGTQYSESCLRCAGTFDRTRGLA